MGAVVVAFGKPIEASSAFYDEQASSLFALSPLTRMRRLCASLAA